MRAGVTLSVLVVMLLGGALWGWSRLTAPFPVAEESVVAAPCSDREISKGQRVSAAEVLVSVYNAGNTSGKATKILGQLEEAGFAVGRTGNAPEGTKVPRAQVWTNDPQSPAVRLVLRHLGGNARAMAGDALGPGVVVVVGDNFENVAKGPRAITANQAATICSPEN